MRLSIGRLLLLDRNLQVQRTYSGRTFKHVLVPVWLVGYTYGSQNYQIVANGYTGAIAGERPYSWVKIALAALCCFGLFRLSRAGVSPATGGGLTA